MLDTTLDILDTDPDYHSYTLDGQSILLDDYLEMRPERREQVERLMRRQKLIAGPYYTLVEQFSVGSEALVRNLMWGRDTVQRYGGKTGTVAYTPCSWGQTGQFPQILRDFGLSRVMFYRGISHDESDAEFVWSAPDGTRVLASRFALYARYNWYYLVHRPVTVGRTFEKDYVWGERDEVPVRWSDGLAGSDMSFELKAPRAACRTEGLVQAIMKMIEVEGVHFTTPIFLAMHGHDLSVAHPLESGIIGQASELLKDRFDIEHTSLEAYWDELEPYLDVTSLPVLVGERRSRLRKGKWTFLFPGTISARTYLKQRDFQATLALVGYAEPLATLAQVLGAPFPEGYLRRGWKYLLSNHTHDANGGCAPDPVCLDMEYRYRKVRDVADIVVADSISHIVRNLAPAGLPPDVMQFVVFNPLPFARDSIVQVDLEVPRNLKAPCMILECVLEQKRAEAPLCQPISSQASSAFVDSIWDVPTILESEHQRFYARLLDLPPLGYRVYVIRPSQEPRGTSSLLKSSNTMANEYLRVKVNRNGTCDIHCLRTGQTYYGLNYLTDQGEVGNAWRHLAPSSDSTYSTVESEAKVAVSESGPLVSAISVDLDFQVPVNSPDGVSRNCQLVSLPVRVLYRLEKGSPGVAVFLAVDNRAEDHWLRANFPTGRKTTISWADSHYDVVSRPIALPDPKGWVEEPGGTHPLQTFVALADDRGLFAVLPGGLFEYEVFDDEDRTLALTLLRACRIKLAVSEEKQTELSDRGAQCPGLQKFDYFIHVGRPNGDKSALLRLAAERTTPVRAVMSGRGQGLLPREAYLFNVSGNVHVSCVKKAESGEGIIIRFFNPSSKDQVARFEFSRKVSKAHLCRMDEAEIAELPSGTSCLAVAVGPKKIRTLKVLLGALPQSEPGSS